VSEQSASTWDVVGIGANSVDLVHLLPAAPQPSGPHAKQRIHRQLVSCGGQMTTALACVAGFGWRTKYIGATGDDERGAVLRAAMQDRRVDMSSALTRPGATNQFAVILVDETTGERIVLWDRDERLALHPDEVPAEAIAAARLVHVDDVDQAAAIAAARLGRAAGIPVTSDIDRLTPHTPELVAAVTIPIFAEHVPPALTGESDAEAALRVLRREHDGLLIVTLGTSGALALDGDRVIRSPAFHVDAIDTTGAGDVFRAGFIHGWLSEWPLERVLRFANAAAAVSCTRLGALAGVPSLPDVEAMLARDARASGSASGS
jgi:sugar/nucleoside kinase (ribokinase family)